MVSVSKATIPASVLALVILLVPISGGAQAITGTIEGRVTDVSGAVLPGVDVTVTNESTGQVRSSVTNETGLYNVPLLPPGTYSVQASLPGFRSELRRGLLLEVDRTARVEIQLQVGEVSEKIEVMADAPLVQADNSSLGQVIDTQRVAELPLNGRQFLQLASLTPGVQPNSQGSNLSTQSGSVNVNGAREVFNNFVLDGIDNNDSGPAQIVVIPSIDAIQEFKVQTSNYSAEYGRSAGGLVNVTTKSGANTLHGSMYEFLRNSAMDAKNFFDRPGKIPGYIRNQFGGTVGGPIVANRTFFFAAYERTGIRQPQTATARVPPAAWRDGDFSTLSTPIIDPLTGQPFTGNIIPQNRINSIGHTMLSLYPLPNATGTNNLVSVQKLVLDNDNVTGRVDHQFSSKDSTFVRYSYWNQPDLEPYSRDNNTIAGYGVYLLTRTQSTTISETHVFNPNMVNEFRFGYARLKGELIAENTTDPRILQLAEPGTRIHDQPTLRPDFREVPIISMVGYTGIPSGGPQIRFDNMWNLVNNLEYTRGAHRMKFGFESRYAENNFHNSSTGNGSYAFENRYSGNAVADMLLGYPTQATRNVGDQDAYSRTWYFAGYGQDDWRLNNKLTFNLGLRYEYQTNGHTIDNRKVTFDTTTGLAELVGSGPIPADIALRLQQFPGIAIKPGNIPPSGWLDDYNNFAPRIGFAYDWAGNGKTVIRGGGGIFYVNMPANKSYGNTQAFPYQITNNVVASTDPRNPNVTLNNPFDPSLLSTGIVGRSVDLHMRTPYMIQQNLGIQRQIGQAMVFEISYAGSKGNGLYRNRNLNAAPLGPGTIVSRRPYPKFSTISQLEGSAMSHYHSLQLRLDRRLSRGISVLGSYTYSKSIDDDSDITGPSGGAPQNYYNLHDDKGPSVFDRTQRLSAAVLWQLPIGENATGWTAGLLKGWQINSIYTASSGQPFTPGLSSDNSLTGTGNDRPNIIANPFPDHPDPSAWVLRSAFGIPALGQFGNAGRNHLRGPGLNNLDFAMFKNFPYKDIAQFVQFRAEIFNIPNHPQFFLPNRFVDSAQFGTLSQARDSRQIQLSLRMSFD
jgi:outer membrane receptor protein involved in Fe transport